MPARHAQKDPGEYLSELRRFAAMSPPAMQRHHIDMSLRCGAGSLAAVHVYVWSVRLNTYTQ